MGSDIQLSYVGHRDLDLYFWYFAVRVGLHAKLQVFVDSVYDMVHPG